MASTVSCPQYPACSGCSSIGIAYAAQLESKLSTVRALFERAKLQGFEAGSINRITPSPSPHGYRNRAKLVPRWALANDAPSAGVGEPREDLGGRLKLGLYRAGSHEVVDIPGCPVQMEGINHVVEIIRDALAPFNVALYDEVSHTGDLRFVAVRQGWATSEILIGFVTRSNDMPGMDELAHHLMERCPGAVGVVHNVNPSKGNVIFGPSNRRLTGRDWYEEIVCGVRLRLGLTSFFQVNSAVAEKAYEAIIRGLAPRAGDVLLDLYSGVGAVGLVAARHVGRVFGIEEVSEAVEFARAASRVNGLKNTEFQTGLVEERLPALMSVLRGRGLTGNRMAAVVNPPRKGVDRKVVAQLLEFMPGRITYLSCSPLTLLRDLDHLTKGGYRVRRVELFDMFPQTELIETLAILEADPRADVPPIRRSRPGRGRVSGSRDGR